MTNILGRAFRPPVQVFVRMGTVCSYLHRRNANAGAASANSQFIIIIKFKIAIFESLASWQTGTTLFNLMAGCVLVCEANDKVVMFVSLPHELALDIGRGAGKGAELKQEVRELGRHVLGNDVEPNKPGL